MRPGAAGRARPEGPCLLRQAILSALLETAECSKDVFISNPAPSVWVLNVFYGFNTLCIGNRKVVITSPGQYKVLVPPVWLQRLIQVRAELIRRDLNPTDPALPTHLQAGPECHH